MMSQVSVIIPTYNRVKLLNNSVASVLSQTYRDFELLVIDDCSTDNTSDFLSNIADRRVRCIKNTSNKGITATRNIALSNANGKYIAFLDDDDEWMPDKLEKQINLMENSSKGLGCIYTGCNLVDAEDNRFNQTTVPHYRIRILNELLLENFIITSSTLIKADCFETVGMFDESMPFAEDYDMWIRIAQAFDFDFVRSPLVNYRIHRNSISFNNSATITGLERLLTKHEKLFLKNKKAYSNHLLRIGVAYCYTGNTREGRKALMKSLEYYKFDKRVYYNLLLTILGADIFKKLKELKKQYLPIRIKTG